MSIRLLGLLCAAMFAVGCMESTPKPKPATNNTGAGVSNTPDRAPGTSESADQSGRGEDSTDYAASDTGRNKRDRDADAVTADNQSESKDDLETTAEIRRGITKDNNLSVNAHNVKIITRGGTVTLRGPVESEEEKSAIVGEAQRIAGDSKVIDDLEIEESSK